MQSLNRTFLGFRPPQALIDQIQETLLLVRRKPGVSDVRWNAPSELIVTLVPLGELSPGTIARVASVVESVCSASPRMTITVDGFSGLPNMIQPRYLVATLGGDIEWLTSLSARLDSAVGNLIPPRDFRAFQPHITLGRLKTESEPNRVALGRAIKLAAVPPMGTIPVEAIELLVSTASTAGIGYSGVNRFLLAT